MNFNNFTIKAQEVVQHAIEVATANHNQIIEPGHLLQGLFSQSENVVGFLLRKLGSANFWNTRRGGHFMPMDSCTERFDGMNT